jgi:hypothetical protein
LCVLLAVVTFTPVFKENKPLRSHKTVEKEGNGSALKITEPDPRDPKAYGFYEPDTDPEHSVLGYLIVMKQCSKKPKHQGKIVNGIMLDYELKIKLPVLKMFLLFGDFCLNNVGT